MPGLDGLRGLAVIAVVVYHFEPTWLPGGFIGVDVFFVMSGFLISSLLLRERGETGAIDMARFVARRLRRLMPALLLLLLALALYAATWADAVELARLRRHGLGTVSYLSNWIFISDGTTYTDMVVGTSPLRHVWSLAIEEQLYLLLAVGVTAVAALQPNAGLRTWFGVVSGALAVASAAWMAWLSFGGASTERTYFGTDTRAQAMLVGAVIGAALVGRPTADRLLVRWAGWTALAMLVGVARIGSEDARWLHRGGFFLVAIGAAAIVVACVSTPSMRALFSHRLLVLVGAVSYGLYLWHWPVLVILDEQRTGLDGAALLVCRIVVSAAAAAGSHVLVERPIRAGVLGRTWGRLAAVPAALSVALVIAVLAWSTIGARPDVETVQADGPAQALPVVTGAEVTGAEDPVDPVVRGHRVVPADPVRVAMLGDSVLHTIIGGEVGAVGLEFTEWRPALTTFDAELVEVVSIAKPACSFLPGEVAVREPNGAYSHASMERFCGDWRTELVEALEWVDVVAVHLTNDVEDRWLDGEHFEFGTDAYFVLLESFLDEVHSATDAAGVPLLLIASAPRTDPTWSDAEGAREALVAAFNADWAAARPDVSTLDLGAILCPDGVCVDRIGGVDTRWDGRHYTRRGAEHVAHELTPVILATAGRAPTVD